MPFHPAGPPARRPPVLALAAFTAILLTGCSSGSPPSVGALRDDAVTIASFDFPESVLLADLYGQALRVAGFTVKLQLNLGSREIVDPALERGLVELVPEYAGTALDFVTGRSDAATAGVRVTHLQLETAFAQRGVTVLAPSPAQDQNGLAVTAETAARYHLRTITDLVPVASQLTFGGPPECPERPLCLPGLRNTYGLRFSKFVPLDAGGPLTVSALQQGQVDVGILFTTSGDVDANPFRLLTDDRGLQPAENVTPVANDEVVDRFGKRLVQVINAVSGELSTTDLRAMNARVSARGERPSAVAAAWLGDHGLAPGTG